MRTLLLFLLMLTAGAAFADEADDEYTPKHWQEEEVKPPAAPLEANWLPVYVSASTDNQYFLDSQSLSIGQDGAVRYTLIVLAGGGAKNVTYEGMRCETRERRIFASGRSDGQWATFKRSEWSKIIDSAKNRHHAALFLDYLCPNGVAVSTPAEAIYLLKTGGYSPGGAR